ncbi:MAG TPA: DUF6048 family protein [Bacteroidales bacterium]|nr:DUF6048 family protein [Bacteroidales bacterium]
MKKTYAYSISLLLLLIPAFLKGQDTIPVPMNIKVAGDIFGPLYSIYDNKNRTLEGFISVDIDTGKSVVLEGGYLSYEYRQNNFYYDYLSHGAFIQAGIDFNLLKPGTALGKYYAGIGLRYGLSIFTQQVPSFSGVNYFGTYTGSVSSKSFTAHFLEICPGIRTELFSHFEIGWSIRLRFLVHSGTGNDMKAIYVPGFGNATKVFSPGINYYLLISIPYKK